MKSLINTEVLPFNATAYHNGKFVAVSDADLRGKWSVVFFYPADFTFVCPTELGDLADNYAEFKKLGVEIYSVSTDTHFTHKAWHDASETIKKIQYVMVGDPTGTISRILPEAQYPPTYHTTDEVHLTRAVPVEVTVSAGLPPGVPVDVQLTPCRTNEVKK